MTLVAEFFEPVRFLLGDHSEEIRLYEDAVIASGVRTVLKGGFIEGYALGADLVSVDPDVTDPNVWIQIVHHVTRRFLLSQPSRQSTRTPGHSESIGDFYRMLNDLDEQISRYENGGGVMFEGWGNLATWIEGYGGVSTQMFWMSNVRLRTLSGLGTTMVL